MAFPRRSPDDSAVGHSAPPGSRSAIPARKTGVLMPSISARIQALVPKQYSQFPKLSGGGSYHFFSWDKDRRGALCLYYWFWDRNKAYKNTKRIPLSEIVTTAQICLAGGTFDRHTFQKRCPVAASDGPCGFAVIGRCLEFLGIAKYAGRGKGFC